MKLYLTSITEKVIDKIDFEGKKKVAFISTAAEPYKNKWFVDLDRDALKKKGLEVLEYEIKGKNEDVLLEELSSFEIIFVSGGNTFYLLEKIRESEFDKAITKLQEKNIIYIGSSAGSVIVGSNIELISSWDDPSITKLTNFDGLGLVDFLILPHYKNPKFKNPEEILKKYSNFKIVTITDDELIVVENNSWKKV